MTDFWTSDVYRTVRAMRDTGNQPGIIARWKAMVEDWANRGPYTADKDAARAWLPYWQPRQFYTASELAPVFPVLAVALRFRDYPAPAMGSARLANVLKFAGLPYYQIDGVDYFGVEQLHRFDEIKKQIEEFHNAQR